MEGMFDIKDIEEKVKVGNGDKMVATKVGSLKCHVQNADFQEVEN